METLSPDRVSAQSDVFGSLTDRKIISLLEDQTTPKEERRRLRKLLRRWKSWPTEHHRLGQSNGGTDTFPENNVILVPRRKHQKFHALFGSMTVEQIVAELNEVWIDPRYKLVIHRR
jgi:ribosomal protein L9